jgi:hypothetical protein
MMRSTFLGKRNEELSHLQIQLVRKFNAFTEMVWEDTEKKWISKAYGRELIIMAIILVSPFTTT